MESKRVIMKSIRGNYRIGSETKTQVGEAKNGSENYRTKGYYK